MHFLNDKIVFPPLSESSADGLLAIGGDLSTERLLYAYQKGIFPWYDALEPILWWAPDPRFIIFPSELKVSKSMKSLFRKNAFNVTVNQNFNEVIKQCSKAKRSGQSGTWITSEMIDAYQRLHELGFAKSIEVWDNDELVGGLYGVDLNNGVFCGESMFSKVSNASKYGFIKFVQESNYRLIDCQLHTNHLESLGGRHIPRSDFIKFL